MWSEYIKSLLNVENNRRPNLSGMGRERAMSKKLIKEMEFEGQEVETGECCKQVEKWKSCKRVWNNKLKVEAWWSKDCGMAGTSV